MGVYISQAGGSPPYPLLLLLEGFEAACLGEFQKEHPNIQLLKKRGEEIEDEAEEMGVEIDWVDTLDCPVAVLKGACFGAFHMTLAVPVHKRLRSRALEGKVELRGWP